MIPKYTFLLPAFKAKYFEEAIISIKNQTFTDYKVLISDDKSPENLKSIFDRIVGDDSRFTYRRNEENMGNKSLVSHWNLLVDMCDTEFLIMASDDDVYEQNFLEDVDYLIRKYPNVDLFRARVKQINSIGEIMREDFICNEYEDKVTFVYDFICMDKIKCIANYVFRTNKLKERGSFVDFPLAWGSDDATVLNMIENGVCQTSNVLFAFRCSGDNISTVIDKKTILGKNAALFQFLQYMKVYFDSMANINSILEKKRIERSRAFFFSGYHTKSLIYGMQFDSFRNVVRYVKFLSSINCLSGTLEKIHIYWSWIKTRKCK